MSNNSQIEQEPVHGGILRYERRILCVAAGIFILFSANHYSRAEVDAVQTQIRFVQPRESQMVTRGTILAAALSSHIRPSEAMEVIFEQSADGQNFRRIPWSAPIGMAPFATWWEAPETKRGRYYLRSRLVAADGTTVDAHSIAVRLNTPPVVRAKVGASMPSDGVVLDATDSHDHDGLIIDYRWQIGSERSVSGQEIMIPGLSRDRYGVTLTVEDDNGGTSEAHYILDVSADRSVTLLDKESCGCRKMDVVDEGTVRGPAGHSFRPYEWTLVKPKEQGRLGPYSEELLGRDTTHINARHRFQVIADLEKDSKPQLCAKGQRVQATQRTKIGQGKDGEDEVIRQAQSRSRGLSSDPRYDSLKSPDDPYTTNDDPNLKEPGIGCGYENEKENWCDDNYHGGGDEWGRGVEDAQPQTGPQMVYTKDQSSILWLDAPGFMSFVRRDHLPAERKFKFEAKVTGPEGNCNCSWEVIIEIDAEGTAESELKNKKCD